MSHFPVLVVGDDVDGQLEAYDENRACPPRREHLDDDDIRRMSQAYGLDPKDHEALAAKMEDWHGCPGGVDEHGLYSVSTSNPDAKWDWYEVGGRWRGFFTLKPGAHGELAPPHWGETMDGQAPRDLQGFADIARKGDIDFDAMRDAAAEDARETWRLFAEAVARTPKQLPLATFLASTPDAASSAEALRAYQRQPRVAAFMAASALQQRLRWGATLEDFPGTEEEYVRMCRRRAGAAFTFVENGEWHETATVGWFGRTLNENDTYFDEFEAMLARTPDDTLFTIVDCHI